VAQLRSDTVIARTDGSGVRNLNTYLDKVDAATSAATPNTLVQRDSSGRAKFAAPAAPDDAARKAEVDGKVSKSGDTMSGELTVDYPNDGGFARIGIRNIAQTLDLSAYWEAGVTQFSQVQSWDIVGNTPRLLRLNPLGGIVSINDFEAWHGGNNIFSLSFSGGYLKLANGLIFQWGALILADGGSVVFPITFPRECLIILPIAKTNAKVWTENETVSGFTLRHDQGANPVPMSYFAIGW